MVEQTYRGTIRPNEIRYETKQPLSPGLKAGIIGIGIAGIIGVGGYAVYGSLSQSSCSNPASACYQALSGYKTEFQNCWNLYVQNLASFQQEDLAQGIALTSAQQTFLQQYLDCANAAAKNLTTAAKTYQVTNPIQYTLQSLLPFLGAGFILYVGGKIALKYYYSKGYRFGNTPGTWAQATRNGMIDYNVATGKYPASSADAMRNNVSDGSASNSTLTQEYIDSLQTEEVISSTEAADLATTESEISASDDTIVEDELAGLFE